MGKLRRFGPFPARTNGGPSSESDLPATVCSDVMPPETRYASVGNDRVAYQVLGKGNQDLVHVTGLWSHVDVAWEEPSVARFLRRL